VEIEIRAYAKLNLFLLVREKRADGYHEIDSFFHSISLSDEITLKRDEKLSFYCNLDELNNPQNLAYKSARLFIKETGIKGAKIHLKKNIPLAAGLGGGSSDAAAVLWGLNEIYGRPLGKEKLLSLTETLGADVPFFIFGGACRVRGKGEKVTPLKPLENLEALLFVFPFTLPTACVYASYKSGMGKEKPTFEDFYSGLKKGERSDLKIYNSLERVVFEKFPQVKEVKKVAQEMGFPAGMSGSGPTVFSLVSSREEKEALKNIWGEFEGKILKVHFTKEGFKAVREACRSTQSS
jgi:4-diphosphocytidyl-2-C-methyl-D-erythritol kinase